jgi:hypothetical protein
MVDEEILIKIERAVMMGIRHSNKSGAITGAIDRTDLSWALSEIGN